MSRTSFIHDIGAVADRYRLDADLLEALVVVESGGHPWAWNPEPRYRYFWDVRRHAPFRKLEADEVASKIPPPDFYAIAGAADNEWWGQQASWGLCQIMGALARERGFRGPYLTELCRPDKNLEIGAGVLADLLTWAGNVDRALGAYNAGKGGAAGTAGRAYAAKVLAARAQIRTL